MGPVYELRHQVSLRLALALCGRLRRKSAAAPTLAGHSARLGSARLSSGGFCGASGFALFASALRTPPQPQPPPPPPRVEPLAFDRDLDLNLDSNPHSGLDADQRRGYCARAPELR